MALMTPRRAERLLPLLLVGPSILFLLLFFALPLAEAVQVAMTSEAGAWSLDNVRRMADDLNFADALRNTALLVAVVVPLQVALALGMALMLQRVRVGRDLVLYIFTIPLGVSDLAAGLVWLAILSETGYMNSVLHALGLLDKPTLWLSYENPVALFVAVIAAEVWRATALVFVILVAGLQLIPKEYGEAAEIFGANPWTRFWKVTLPLLKGSLRTALILRTVLAFEVFSVVLVLGGRDLPVLAGESYAWLNAFQNRGVAGAYALLILGISVVATLVYLRLLRVREEPT